MAMPQLPVLIPLLFTLLIPFLSSSPPPPPPFSHLRLFGRGAVAFAYPKSSTLSSAAWTATATYPPPSSTAPPKPRPPPSSPPSVFDVLVANSQAKSDPE